jgi:bifunctional non-homologous end joining protein LigD
MARLAAVRARDQVVRSMGANTVVSVAPSPLDAIPAVLEPQLCTLVEQPPSGADWLHEIKYDGWRLLARKCGDDVRLYTRGGIEWSQRLPRLVEAIRGLSVATAWLDGEIVRLDDAGFPDFEQLQRDMRARAEGHLFFHVFDVPWLNGDDLTRRRLFDRKTLLREAIGGADAQIRFTDHIVGSGADAQIRFTDHIVGSGADVFARANALDLEGIVSKRIDSAYHAGVRSRDWQKAKCWRRLTVLIGGVLFDSEGHIEGLLAGTPTDRGLRYEGLVEFGLGRVGDLRELILSLATTEPPFIGGWKPSPRRFWLRPESAIEIRALPRRPGRLLRHATVLHFFTRSRSTP